MNLRSPEVSGSHDAQSPVGVGKKGVSLVVELVVDDVCVPVVTGSSPWERESAAMKAAGSVARTANPIERSGAGVGIANRSSARMRDSLSTRTSGMASYMI